MSHPEDFRQDRAAPLGLALFQPDIPQNAGTIIRMAACFALPVSIIEPCGFPVSDRAFRRAGMDYLDHVEVIRHASWAAFEDWRATHGARLVLATTKGSVAHTDFAFRRGDILMLGRESAGAPEEAHAVADGRVRIPMRVGLRSLNIAVSAAILTGEALRQLGGFPIEGA